VVDSGDQHGLGAGAVKVDIGRGSLIAVLILIPICTLLSGACVYVALDAPDRGTAVIGSCFAAFFGAPVLIALVTLRKLLRPRGLAFDGRGVHYWEGSSWTLVAWQDIAGIGIGYEEPPEFTARQHLANQLLDQLKIERRRKIAVEIFPADPKSIERQPSLMRYRRDQKAPTEKLPSVRWRLLLPPAPGLTAKVTQGVESFQPARWLGWFARPWRGGLGA
jgi:hypothetical protein